MPPTLLQYGQADTATEPWQEEQSVDQSPQPTAASTQVEDQAALSQIKLWQSRITRAKVKWKPDFDRMKKNQEFCSGLQWEGQTEIDDDKYMANVALRMVNQKVATLYARNPTAVAKPRKRLDYQVWDGDQMSIIQAIQQGSQLVAETGPGIPPEMDALFQDYQAGKQKEALIKRVAQTIEIVYQYFVDASKPEFKSQAKQAVRRAIVCGVAYFKAILCSDTAANYKSLSSIDTRSGIHERVARAKEILDELQEGDIQEDSAKVATLHSLLMSIGASQQMADETKLPVRLEFDFPQATSIIVDENCRNLEEFVSARWIAQEYILPVSEVNALFGVEVEVGEGEGTATEKFPSPPPSLNYQGPNVDKEQSPKDVCVWEVFDYNTKTRFFICEGWKDYLLAPEPVYPSVSGFWPIQALVFNGIEIEPGGKASIYPPSDVQLIKSAQMEWNRTRDALRAQRNANAPKYLVRKGMITDKDRMALRNAVPNSVIELEGVPPDQPLDKFIVIMQTAAIDEAVYNTQQLEQDMMIAGGMQQANVGPAQPDVTATVGSIAEQSRMTVVQSNIDDLDGVLSRLAQMGGEMLLRALPAELATKIAGVGAAWPEESREDFVDEVFLSIAAASAGRPNKAMEIQNFQQLAPIMQAAGANPVGMLELAAERLDDQMDMSRLFPLQVPASTQTPPGSGASSSEGEPASQAPGPMEQGGDHQLPGPGTVPPKQPEPKPSNVLQPQFGQQ